MRGKPLVSYDYNNMLAAAVGKGGTSPDEHLSILRGLSLVRVALLRAQSEGRLGFLDIAARRKDADASLAVAQNLPGDVHTLVVIGTGASDLVPRALVSALSCGSRFSAKKKPTCRMDVRFIGSNVDPDELT